jgi:RNA polymerase sigma-70 factor (ECF subfamily)
LIPVEKITETSWQELMRAVRSYVGRRISDPEDRDDLVQDVLLRIHRGLASLKAQASPGPWIYGIAHNAIVDHWRKRGRAGVSVPIDDAETDLGELPAEADDGDLLQQTVAAYLANMVTRLDSPYRETLTLTELQSMKYADVARTLGISLAAVKSRVLRGREMLRKALIRCCEIELGATGRVLDCTPRGQGVCESCQPAPANTGPSPST